MEELLLRRPVPNDLEELIELVKEYCEDNHIEYDEKTIRTYLIVQISQLPSVVAVQDNKVVGAVSFIILPDHFKADKYIAEKMAIFVSKEYRNKDIGTKLLNKAEQVCKEQGIKQFYFKGSIRPKGYKEIERQYMKEL